MGENVRFTSLRITMPFKESGGDNLKVLRYDNYMMDFVEEDFLVDKINKTPYYEVIVVVSCSSGRVGGR